MYSANTPHAEPAKGDKFPHKRKRIYKPNNDISDMRILKLSGSDNKDEALTEKRFKSMLKNYAKESGANGGEKLPGFSLFTVHGDPTLIELSSGSLEQPPTGGEEIGFSFLNELFPRSVHIRSVNSTTRRPVSALYCDDGFITIHVHMGRSRRNVFCVMKILHTPHLRSVAFVSCRHPSDLAEVRTLCSANHEFLGKNPLALLSLLYEQRVRIWEKESGDLFDSMNEIEMAHGMLPEGWELVEPPSRERADGDVLNEQFAQINTQICHAHSMAAQGVRFASFCLEVARVIETEARRVNNESFQLERKAIMEYEDRIQNTESLCHSVLERLNDLGDRHRGLSSIIHNAIALEEMRINRIVAISGLNTARRTAMDGSIMKIIAVLGAVFLPAAFTSALWQAGVFEIQGEANGVLFTVVTVALTVLIMTGGILYMRRAGRSTALQRDELGADPAMV